LADREFFSGEYGFPECALTARFGLAENYGVEIPAEYTNLRNWFLRMKQRPSYLQTCPPRPQFSAFSQTVTNTPNKKATN